VALREVSQLYLGGPPASRSGEPLLNPYAGCKIRGPYGRSNGRKFVSIVCPDGDQIRVGYSRYLVECDLGRHLSKEEHVHHINEDFTDDRLENLEVLDAYQHLRMHRLGKPNPRQKGLPQDFVCPVCEVTFTMSGFKIRQLISKRKAGKCLSGPYCSPSCSAKGWQSGITIQTPVMQKYPGRSR